ncbi:ferredoxin--NADP reductase [Fidelibacter multiformis]|uniref:ferredoxin--NADP reductase n=1 Tax=Fidelibacter multiformis TaxID=3377529 RepID=UPI0037DC99A0
MKTEYNAVVGQKINISPTLMILRVVPLGWELSPFKPGQFTMLALPADAPHVPEAEPPEREDTNTWIRRPYSASSSKDQQQYIEFYIRLVYSGELTPRLFALKTGDKLYMFPKLRGMLTLDAVEKEKNILFVATGTGLAPYMSMIRSETPCRNKQKIAVIHGALNSGDLGFRAELEHLERLCDNFSYVPVISHQDREKIPWTGKTGFVQDIWHEGIVDDLWHSEIRPENTAVFLCGHPEMISQMVELLGESGFKPYDRKKGGSIFYEDW